MPADDITHFIYSAGQRNDIGPDTCDFWLFYAPDSDQFIGSFDMRLPPKGGARKHGHTLSEAGITLEHEMLSRTAKSLDQRLALAASVHGGLDLYVEAFVDSMATDLVDSGFTELSLGAIGRANLRWGMDRQLAVLRRSCMRAYHTTRGWDPDLLSRGIEVSNAQWSEYHEVGDSPMAEIIAQRRRLGVTDVDNAERARREKRTLAYMRGQLRRDRGILKRSIKLAERFLGCETTRMFVGRQAIRIEGRLATYELSLSQGLLGSHGACTLSVLTREGDIRLCNLCIYSQGVPVLDHVAGILLSIKAGEEEEILKVGNAYGIEDGAYGHDWLVPYLPKRVVRTGPDGVKRVLRTIIARDDPRYVELANPVRRERLVRMRGDVTAHMLDHLGDVIPPMGITITHLITGRNRVHDNLGVAEGHFDVMPLRRLDPRYARHAQHVDLDAMRNLDETIYAHLEDQAQRNPPQEICAA